MEQSKRIIGIMLMIISILGIVTWEKWGKEQLVYDEILVLRENVEQGTVVTEDMLMVKPMDVDERCLTAEDKAGLLGKQTAGFVHKGVPLFDEYFAEADLSPSEHADTYVLSLAEDWILSRPETLSRGDRVFCFSGEKCILTAKVSCLGESGQVELIVSRKQAETVSKVVSRGGRLVLVYR